MDINFNEAVESNNGGTVYTRVERGAQVLTIENVEDVQGSTNPAINITYRSGKNDATFTERTFLTPKALPKLIHIVESFTGSKPSGNITTDKLAAQLIGKSAFVVVDEEEYLSTKTDSNGNPYVNKRAKLRFNNFAQPVNTPAELKFTDDMAKLIPLNTANTPKKEETPVTVDNGTDDLPF